MADTGNCASDGVCRPPGRDGLASNGESCSDNRDCLYFYCSGTAVCADKYGGQLMDACGVDDDCETSNCASDGVCRPYGQDGPAPNGALCTIDDTCASGYCSSDGMCDEAPSSPSMKARHRRSVVNLSAAFQCGGFANGLTACPLPRGGYECVDTLNSLENCGGCLNTDPGAIDCSMLGDYGALEVACVSGACVVKSCDTGFYPSADASICVSATPVSHRQSS